MPAISSFIKAFIALSAVCISNTAGRRLAARGFAGVRRQVGEFVTGGMLEFHEPTGPENNLWGSTCETSLVNEVVRVFSDGSVEVYMEDADDDDDDDAYKMEPQKIMHFEKDELKVTQQTVETDAEGNSRNNIFELIGGDGVAQAFGRAGREAGTDEKVFVTGKKKSGCPCCKKSDAQKLKALIAKYGGGYSKKADEELQARYEARLAQMRNQPYGMRIVKKGQMEKAVSEATAIVPAAPVAEENSF